MGDGGDTCATVSVVDVLAAFGSGAVAGLGVAMPLGAIAVLLIGEGVARGFAGAWPAGLAVGLVDTAYAALAVVLGTIAAPLIAGWGDWPALVGGLALVVLAGYGLWRARPGRDGSPPPPPTAGGGRLFLLFLGLTAINPATLIYFAAITVGLSGLLATPVSAGVFVAGVGASSVSWQLLVIGLGALLGGRTSPRARQVTAVIGNLIVGALGVGLIATALV